MRKTITANILFSGIGAQERGFENTGLFDVHVLHTSEINKEAVLAYAAVHKGLTEEMIDTYKKYPSEEQMAADLLQMNLGYDSDKSKPFNWYRLCKHNTQMLKKYWLANHLCNNLGDISLIQELPYADLWTTSFPCQDISVSGAMRGFTVGSSTRSSLLWESIRLLKNAVSDGTAPKFLLFENVKNLVSKKFYDDFCKLIELLEELGYNTYWQVLNGKDCGIPQNRERVFVLAVRKDVDTGLFEFPQAFDSGWRAYHFLDDEVDNKYIYKAETPITFFDGVGNVKCVRKLTSKECWRLMGFTDIDYENARNVGLSESSLYKQAGNSIITNCVSLIAEHMYKAFYDVEFKCTDTYFADTAFICATDNKPRLVGGIGQKNYGKQYRQGNRVYSAENVAMACLAQPIGNAGGNSYLYAIPEITTPNSLIQVGTIDNEKWRESRRRIYSPVGCIPALHGIGAGGNTEPKIVVDDTYKGREARLYSDYVPTLRAERAGFKVIHVEDGVHD